MFALVTTLLVSVGLANAPLRAPVADTGWTKRAAIYEVFVRDFSPTGNFEGVTTNLDRIQAAGANVIWLMPIYPIGSANRKGSLGSPYAVANYRGINPDFGTEANFRKLVKAVHARGMKIILDFVPNHTAFDHVWVKQHPDRYTRDEKGNISVARDNDGKLTDWTDVADLNYSSEDTRQAVIADMRYWLDTFGIDGFRVDVAGFIPDDFWKEAVPKLRRGKNILLLAEWGDPKMHSFGFDLTYGWDTYSRLKNVWKGESAANFVAQEIKDMQSLPNGGMRLRFTTNHDETAWDNPPVTIFGGHGGARAAFVAIAMLPGAPLLYNGQEVESPQKIPLFEKEPVAWNQTDARDARTFYRRIIALSRGINAKTITPIETTAASDIIAYRRGPALVFVNTRARPVRFTANPTKVRGLRDAITGSTQSTADITLPPYGALILEQK